MFENDSKLFLISFTQRPESIHSAGVIPLRSSYLYLMEMHTLLAVDAICSVQQEVLAAQKAVEFTCKILSVIIL